MARKTINYTVVTEGRDKGKTFVITEMDADKAEAWAFRALLAIMANNAELPDGLERMGVAAMVEIGIKAISGLKWEVAKPLLDEMMECVTFSPDPLKPHVTRKLFDGDIEELMTRVKLRGEIWKLHTDFFAAVRASI